MATVFTPISSTKLIVNWGTSPAVFCIRSLTFDQNCTIVSGTDSCNANAFAMAGIKSYSGTLEGYLESTKLPDSYTPDFDSGQESTLVILPEGGVSPTNPNWTMSVILGSVEVKADIEGAKAITISATWKANGSPSIRITA